MKHSIKALFVIPFLLFFAAESYAQMAVGVSYENRSEKPTSGFGLHFQSDISPLPVISLNIRLHGSYFSEEYKFTAGGLSGERTDTSYDFGLALLGGVSAGIVAPYAGVGIGMEFFERETTIGLISSEDENSFFYYGVVGVGMSALPFVRPYIEYRYRGITSSDFMPSEYGTWAFGVQLRF
jgi:opacity protein-like surface antigen